MFAKFKKLLSLIIISLFFTTKLFASNINDLDDFAVIWSEVVNFKQVYLYFNYNLSTNEDYIRDFSIINNDDLLDELYVEKSEIDEENPKKILLTFDVEAQPNWTYELFVINLQDEYWRKIKDWINSITTFSMPEEFIIQEEIEKQEENIEIIEDEKEQIQESETIDDNIQEEENSIELQINSNDNELISDEELELNSWVDVWSDFIETNILWESKNIDTLPKTWPANLFILVLLSVFVSLIFIFKFKKS